MANRIDIVCSHCGQLNTFVEIQFKQPVPSPVPVEDDPKLNLSIELLDISVRPYNCLKFAEIKTIGQLLGRTRADMMRIKNLGKISLAEIECGLRALGLGDYVDQRWPHHARELSTLSGPLSEAAQTNHSNP